jgi:hypothetical protein
MTAHDDDRLRSWIASRDPGPAPQTLRASTARVASTAPRPATLPRVGWPRIRSTWRLALAAVVTIAIAMAGIGLVRLGDVARPRISPPPTPPASPLTATDPQLPFLGSIEPGRYVTAAPGTAVHMTLPTGWGGNGGGVGKSSTAFWQSSLDLAVWRTDVAYVVRDVCTDEADVAFEPVGPSAAELATALARQVGVVRSGPTDVTLGGYPAKRFAYTLDPACAGTDSHALWADARRVYGFSLRPGETGIVDVVDVDSNRLVITSQYGADASAEDVAELEAIAASIGIEPIPGARPSFDPGSDGWLALGPHSLTVDGVPLSFSVPTRDTAGGWHIYGNGEISKNVAGPDHAEAMVFWTAYPAGAATTRCAGLDLPVAGSIDDLAAAVSTARGTDLVSGPTFVTLGGRPARHVVLTVRVDRGCDAKYFFGSEPPPGGPGWWTTDGRDTIRVWLVDVDGTRLFIAGLSKPTAGSVLEQEIEDIVDSIRFG